MLILFHLYLKAAGGEFGSQLLACSPAGGKQSREDLHPKHCTKRVQYPPLAVEFIANYS